MQWRSRPSWRRTRLGTESEVFAAAVPLSLAAEGSSSPGCAPLQSSSPPPGRPTRGRIRLPWALRSLQRHHAGGPRLRRAVQLSPRFRSQVISTSQRLPSSPALRGLVSCHSRSWASCSLQRFPLAEIAHPSRGRLLPCSSPLPLRDALPGALSPPVSPTPTLSHAAPGSPGDYERPFGSPAGELPGLSGPRTAEPSLHGSFVYFEAFFLLRIRSRRPGLPRLRRSILSWASRPSRAFSSLASDPRPAQALEPAHGFGSVDSNPRLEGPRDPSSQVRPARHHERRDDLVGETWPPSRPARTASRRPILLP